MTIFSLVLVAAVVVLAAAVLYLYRLVDHSPSIIGGGYDRRQQRRAKEAAVSAAEGTHEIEVKARAGDLAALRAQLEQRGCAFSEPVRQADAVYVRQTGSLDEFLSNDVFLRIRIQNDGTALLTAKRPKGAIKAESLVKEEYETAVASPEEMRRILALAGFQEAVCVVKTRRKAHLGAYEVCLDAIEGLGSFIELEQMAEEAQAARIQEDMMAFLASLGVKPDARVTKGYDILMLEQQRSAAR